MKVFDRNIVVTGVFTMAFTIAIGAFGAHGLKQLVDGAALDTFEVGVRYQMYHALAILILGFAPWISSRLKKTIFLLFIVGILFFSGSIYLLSLNSVLPFNAAKIGFITPIGGVLFIVGWLYWGFGMIKSRKE